MTRQQMITKLAEADAEVICEWVNQGCYEDLFEFLSEKYLHLDDTKLQLEYRERLVDLPEGE